MMEQEIERAVRDFESGRLSRRQFVTRMVGLTVLAAGQTTGAAQASSTFKATGLNHIALSVTDIPRSRDFYVKHLGLRVSSESTSSCFLTFGTDFLALFRSSRAGLNHYCYAIEDYSVQAAAEKLRGHGIEPRITSGRIYFPDPDGLTVQLAAEGHRV